MNKYSLIAKTENKELEIIIKSDLCKSPKQNLRNIDLYTTNFNNENELIEDIKNKNPEIKEINDLYIKEYKFPIMIAYKDKEILSELEVNGNDKVNQDDQKFKSILYNYLKMLEDKEFFEYIINNNMIKEEEKEFAKDRIIGGDYSNHLLYRISSSLSSYSDLRELLFIMNKYELNKINKELQYKIKTLKRNF